MEGLQTSEHSSRVLFFTRSFEYFGRLTEVFVVASQVCFLLFQSLLFLSISTKLDGITYAQWDVVFLPAWVGGALTLGLLMCSWFASCPYIKRCIAQNSTRVGSDQNPSLINEVIPEIGFAVCGFFLTLGILLTEYFLCSWASSKFTGSSVPFLLSGILVAMICVCYGVVIVQENSQLFNILGGATIMSLLSVVVEDRFSVEIFPVLFLFPFALASLVFIVTGVYSYREAKDVLCEEEIFLCGLSGVLQFCIFLALLSAMIKGYGAVIPTRGTFVDSGVVLFASTIGLAIIRIRFLCNNLNLGTVSDRLRTAFCCEHSACTECLPGGPPDFFCPLHGRLRQQTKGINNRRRQQQMFFFTASRGGGDRRLRRQSTIDSSPMMMTAPLITTPEEAEEEEESPLSKQQQSEKPLEQPLLRSPPPPPAEEEEEEEEEDEGETNNNG